MLEKLKLRELSGEPIPKLRMGVLLEDLNRSDWMNLTIEKLRANSHLEIVLVRGINKCQSTQDKGFSNQKTSRIFFRVIYSAYLWLDRLIFSGRRHHPQDELFPLLTGSSHPKVSPFQCDGSQVWITEQGFQEWKAYNFDVLLLLGTGTPSQKVQALATYGVWCFDPPEDERHGQAPLGFWEVLAHRPYTLRSLKAFLCGNPQPVILHQHHGPTDLRSISRTCSNLVKKSPTILTKKLSDLQRVASLDCIREEPSIDNGSLAGKAPSGRRMLGMATQFLGRFVKDRLNDFRYVEQWDIGLKFAPSEDPFAVNLSDYTWLSPPKDRFWADPFTVHKKSHYLLFFEELLYLENKGKICVAAIDQSGFLEQPVVLLEDSSHYSYPFVFQWEGEWFLIPESQEATRVDLFKFNSFPYQLRHHQTILGKVKAADTTLFEHENRWWMFVSLASEETWNVDELWLFFAETPMGPWKSHPQNPIKMDVRSSRPAGKVFSQGGKLIRPAQDCSQGYGYAVRFQEITELSIHHYAEEEVGSILPSSLTGVFGVHTFNQTNGLTAVDAKRWCAR